MANTPTARAKVLLDIVVSGKEDAVQKQKRLLDALTATGEEQLKLWRQLAKAKDQSFDISNLSEAYVQLNALKNALNEVAKSAADPALRRAILGSDSIDVSGFTKNLSTIQKVIERVFYTGNLGKALRTGFSRLLNSATSGGEDLFKGLRGSVAENVARLVQDYDKGLSGVLKLLPGFRREFEGMLSSIGNDPKALQNISKMFSAMEANAQDSAEGMRRIIAIKLSFISDDLQTALSEGNEEAAKNLRQKYADTLNDFAKDPRFQKALAGPAGSKFIEKKQIDLLAKEYESKLLEAFSQPTKELREKMLQAAVTFRDTVMRPQAMKLLNEGSKEFAGYFKLSGDYANNIYKILKNVANVKGFAETDVAGVRKIYLGMVSLNEEMHVVNLEMGKLEVLMQALGQRSIDVEGTIAALTDTSLTGKQEATIRKILEHAKELQDAGIKINVGYSDNASLIEKSLALEQERVKLAREEADLGPEPEDYGKIVVPQGVQEEFNEELYRTGGLYDELNDKAKEFAKTQEEIAKLEKLQKVLSKDTRATQEQKDQVKVVLDNRKKELKSLALDFFEIEKRIGIAAELANNMEFTTIRQLIYKDLPELQEKLVALAGRTPAEAALDAWEQIQIIQGRARDRYIEDLNRIAEAEAKQKGEEFEPYTHETAPDGIKYTSRDEQRLIVLRRQLVEETEKEMRATKDRYTDIATFADTENLTTDILKTQLIFRNLTAGTKILIDEQTRLIRALRFLSNKAQDFSSSFDSAEAVVYNLQQAYKEGKISSERLNKAIEKYLNDVSAQAEGTPLPKYKNLEDQTSRDIYQFGMPQGEIDNSALEQWMLLWQTLTGEVSASIETVTDALVRLEDLEPDIDINDAFDVTFESIEDAAGNLAQTAVEMIADALGVEADEIAEELAKSGLGEVEFEKQSGGTAAAVEALADVFGEGETAANEVRDAVNAVTEEMSDLNTKLQEGSDEVDGFAEEIDNVVLDTLNRDVDREGKGRYSPLYRAPDFEVLNPERLRELSAAIRKADADTQVLAEHLAVFDELKEKKGPLTAEDIQRLNDAEQAIAALSASGAILPKSIDETIKKREELRRKGEELDPIPGEWLEEVPEVGKVIGDRLLESIYRRINDLAATRQKGIGTSGKGKVLTEEAFSYLLQKELRKGVYSPGERSGYLGQEVATPGRLQIPIPEGFERDTDTVVEKAMFSMAAELLQKGVDTLQDAVDNYSFPQEYADRVLDTFDAELAKKGLLVPKNKVDELAQKLQAAVRTTPTGELTLAEGVGPTLEELDKKLELEKGVTDAGETYDKLKALREQQREAGITDRSTIAKLSHAKRKFEKALTALAEYEDGIEERIENDKKAREELFALVQEIDRYNYSIEDALKGTPGAETSRAKKILDIIEAATERARKATGGENLDAPEFDSIRNTLIQQIPEANAAGFDALAEAQSKLIEDLFDDLPQELKAKLKDVVRRGRTSTGHLSPAVVTEMAAVLQEIFNALPADLGRKKFAQLKKATEGVFNDSYDQVRQTWYGLLESVVGDGVSEADKAASLVVSKTDAEGNVTEIVTKATGKASAFTKEGLYQFLKLLLGDDLFAALEGELVRIADKARIEAKNALREELTERIEKRNIAEALAKGKTPDEIIALAEQLGTEHAKQIAERTKEGVAQSLAEQDQKIAEAFFPTEGIEGIANSVSEPVRKLFEGLPAVVDTLAQAFDPDTGKVFSGEPEVMTRKELENLKGLTKKQQEERIKSQQNRKNQYDSFMKSLRDLLLVKRAVMPGMPEEGIDISQMWVQGDIKKVITQAMQTEQFKGLDPELQARIEGSVDELVSYFEEELRIRGQREQEDLGEMLATALSAPQREALQEQDPNWRNTLAESYLRGKYKTEIPEDIAPTPVTGEQIREMLPKSLFELPDRLKKFLSLSLEDARTEISNALREFHRLTTRRGKKLDTAAIQDLKEFIQFMRQELPDVFAEEYKKWGEQVEQQREEIQKLRSLGRKKRIELKNVRKQINSLRKKEIDQVSEDDQALLEQLREREQSILKTAVHRRPLFEFDRAAQLERLKSDEEFAREQEELAKLRDLQPSAGPTSFGPSGELVGEVNESLGTLGDLLKQQEEEQKRATSETQKEAAERAKANEERAKIQKLGYEAGAANRALAPAGVTTTHHEALIQEMADRFGATFAQGFAAGLSDPAALDVFTRSADAAAGEALARSEGDEVAEKMFRDLFWAIQDEASKQFAQGTAMSMRRSEIRAEIEKTGVGKADLAGRPKTDLKFDESVGLAEALEKKAEELVARAMKGEMTLQEIDEQIGLLARDPVFRLKPKGTSDKYALEGDTVSRMLRERVQSVYADFEKVYADLIEAGNVEEFLSLMDRFAGQSKKETQETKRAVKTSYQFLDEVRERARWWAEQVYENKKSREEFSKNMRRVAAQGQELHGVDAVTQVKVAWSAYNEHWEWLTSGIEEARKLREEIDRKAKEAAQKSGQTGPPTVFSPYGQGGQFNAAYGGGTRGTGLDLERLQALASKTGEELLQIYREEEELRSRNLDLAVKQEAEERKRAQASFDAKEAESVRNAIIGGERFAAEGEKPAAALFQKFEDLAVVYGPEVAQAFFQGWMDKAAPESQKAFLDFLQGLTGNELSNKIGNVIPGTLLRQSLAASLQPLEVLTEGVSLLGQKLETTATEAEDFSAVLKRAIISALQADPTGDLSSDALLKSLLDEASAIAEGIQEELGAEAARTWADSFFRSLAELQSSDENWNKFLSSLISDIGPATTEGIDTGAVETAGAEAGKEYATAFQLGVESAQKGEDLATAMYRSKALPGGRKSAKEFMDGWRSVTEVELEKEADQATADAIAEGEERGRREAEAEQRGRESVAPTPAAPPVATAPTPTPTPTTVPTPTPTAPPTAAPIPSAAPTPVAPQATREQLLLDQENQTVWNEVLQQWTANNTLWQALLTHDEVKIKKAWEQIISRSALAEETRKVVEQELAAGKSWYDVLKELAIANELWQQNLDELLKGRVKAQQAAAGPDPAAKAASDSATAQKDTVEDATAEIRRLIDQLHKDVGTAAHGLDLVFLSDKSLATAEDRLAHLRVVFKQVHDSMMEGVKGDDLTVAFRVYVDQAIKGLDRIHQKELLAGQQQDKRSVRLKVLSEKLGQIYRVAGDLPDKFGDIESRFDKLRTLTLQLFAALGDLSPDEVAGELDRFTEVEAKQQQEFIDQFVQAMNDALQNATFENTAEAAKFFKRMRDDVTKLLSQTQGLDLNVGGLQGLLPVIDTKQLTADIKSVDEQAKQVFELFERSGDFKSLDEIDKWYKKILTSIDKLYKMKPGDNAGEKAGDVQRASEWLAGQIQLFNAQFLDGIDEKLQRVEFNTEKQVETYFGKIKDQILKQIKVTKDAGGDVTGLEEAFKKVEAAAEVAGAKTRDALTTKALAKDIGQQIERLDQTLMSLSYRFTHVAFKFKLFGAAGIGAFAITTRAAREFSREVAKISAILTSLGNIKFQGDIARDFEDVRDRVKSAVLDLASSTVFSVQEITTGMKALAQTSLTFQQSLSVLPRLLEFAAASDMNLADAVRATVGTMRAFNLEATEMERITNVLASAAFSTNAEVKDFTASFKYVGPVAAKAGISLEETSAAVGKLAEAGIRGSMAGTTLRRAISHLLAPTGRAADLMDQFGIRTLDAEGNMLPLANIIGQFNNALGDTAGEAEKAAIIMETFGLRAGPGMVALINAGEQQLTELTASLRASGVVSAIATAEAESLGGQLKILSDSWKALLTTIGEGAETNPFFVKAIELTNGLVNTIRELIEESELLKQILSTGLGVSLLAGALAGLVGLMGTLFTGFVSLMSVMITFKSQKFDSLFKLIKIAWEGMDQIAKKLKGSSIETNHAMLEMEQIIDGLVAKIDELTRAKKDAARATDDLAAATERESDAHERAETTAGDAADEAGDRIKERKVDVGDAAKDGALAALAMKGAAKGAEEGAKKTRLFSRAFTKLGSVARWVSGAVFRVAALFGTIIGTLSLVAAGVTAVVAGFAILRKGIEYLEKRFGVFFDKQKEHIYYIEKTQNKVKEFKDEVIKTQAEFNKMNKAQQELYLTNVRKAFMFWELQVSLLTSKLPEATGDALNTMWKEMSLAEKRMKEFGKVLRTYRIDPFEAVKRSLQETELERATDAFDGLVSEIGGNKLKEALGKIDELSEGFKEIAIAELEAGNAAKLMAIKQREAASAGLREWGDFGTAMLKTSHAAVYGRSELQKQLLRTDQDSFNESLKATNEYTVNSFNLLKKYGEKALMYKNRQRDAEARGDRAEAEQSEQLAEKEVEAVKNLIQQNIQAYEEQYNKQVQKAKAAHLQIMKLEDEKARRQLELFDLSDRYARSLPTDLDSFFDPRDRFGKQADDLEGLWLEFQHQLSAGNTQVANDLLKKIEEVGRAGRSSWQKDIDEAVKAQAGRESSVSSTEAELIIQYYTKDIPGAYEYWVNQRQALSRAEGRDATQSLSRRIAAQAEFYATSEESNSKLKKSSDAVYDKMIQDQKDIGVQAKNNAQIALDAVNEWKGAWEEYATQQEQMGVKMSNALAPVLDKVDTMRQKMIEAASSFENMKIDPELSRLIDVATSAKSGKIVDLTTGKEYAAADTEQFGPNLFASEVIGAQIAQSIEKILGTPDARSRNEQFEQLRRAIDEAQAARPKEDVQAGNLSSLAQDLSFFLKGGTAQFGQFLDAFAKSIGKPIEELSFAVKEIELPGGRKVLVTDTSDPLFKEFRNFSIQFNKARIEQDLTEKESLKKIASALALKFMNKFIEAEAKKEEVATLYSRGYEMEAASAKGAYQELIKDMVDILKESGIDTTQFGPLDMVKLGQAGVADEIYKAMLGSKQSLSEELARKRDQQLLDKINSIKQQEAAETQVKAAEIMEKAVTKLVSKQPYGVSEDAGGAARAPKDAEEAAKESVKSMLEAAKPYGVSEDEGGASTEEIADAMVDAITRAGKSVELYGPPKPPAKSTEDIADDIVDAITRAGKSVELGPSKPPAKEIPTSPTIGPGEMKEIDAAKLEAMFVQDLFKALEQAVLVTSAKTLQQTTQTGIGISPQFGESISEATTLVDQFSDRLRKAWDEAAAQEDLGSRDNAYFKEIMKIIRELTQVKGTNVGGEEAIAKSIVAIQALTVLTNDNATLLKTIVDGEVQLGTDQLNEHLVDVAIEEEKLQTALRGLVDQIKLLRADMLAKGATVAGKRYGGFIKRYARGGHLPGYGGGDSVPALLEPGEYVLPKEAVQGIGVNTLEWLRRFYTPGVAFNIPRMAKGGMVAGRNGGSSVKGVYNLNLSINGRQHSVFGSKKDVQGLIAAFEKERMTSSR